MDSHNLSLAGFYPHLFTSTSRSPEGLVHLFLGAFREFCIMFKKEPTSLSYLMASAGFSGSCPVDVCHL